MAQHQFQTEVNELLQLIIHSLYSHREIFLRELISNASDALDKLKYLTVSDDGYKSISFEPAIEVAFDKEAKTITVSDNGIGMSEQDLIESLGTIARSGTKQFLAQLAEDAKKDSNLIGQFGVGFYSAFMVSEKIEVISRKAGEQTAYKWVSDGKEGFEVEEAVRDTQGTTVILHLSEDGVEYANRWSIEDVLKRYSNHIAFPIFLSYDESEYDDKGEVKSTEHKHTQVNSGTALWRKPKIEITDDEYKAFYKQLGRDTEDPLFWVHTKAEGALEYTTLFYVPFHAPYDLYHADFQAGVKLYVKRIYITDDNRELLPIWLRFIKGVIDSEDIPLNVSRETLQFNRVLTNIRNASVKKLLNEFKALADKAASGAEGDVKKWEDFIAQFNRPLKEGLYQDWSNRELLQELVRFHSSSVDGRADFAGYVSRMKPDQKYIYYITGGDEKTLKASPLLEAYKKNSIEVLIMDDDIDALVMQSVNRYKVPKPEGSTDEAPATEYELKAVNKAGSDEEIANIAVSSDDKDPKPVLEKIKTALGDRVKEVKVSKRLTDSPSCIVADENDPTMQTAQMLKALGQPTQDVVPILEVNINHKLVSQLFDTEDSDFISDISEILLDQALLVDGIAIKDPVDFVTRLYRLLVK